MDNKAIIEQWKDKPQPKPEDYGFVTATSPEDQVGNWTVEGGQAKYFEDMGHWEEAQDDAAFQKSMQELEAGQDEKYVNPED